MKKSLKVVLKVLGVLLLLSIVIGVGVFYYVKSTHFDFEGDYPENKNLQELTIDSYTFVDRNGNGELDVYEDERRTIDERVDDVLAQMTMEEKIHLLKGSGIASAAGFNEPGEGIPGAVGTIVPTPRLGLPTVYLSDGPAGLRIQPTREGEDRTYYCTAFPIATLLASTWNEELVYQVGEAMGDEAKEYGLDVILGPGMNLHRHPLCGRNFEYYSEDPVLSGYIAAAMVNGIESNEIGTSIKHFVANNQETDRDLNDVIISERAMREIYLKGFEIVVREAQPWTIMSSYNKVNGEYTSESAYLLTDVLRDDWGFEGLVMTDWFGGRNAAAQISAGNDLLEPGTKKQWKALTEAAAEGSLSEAAIDQAARRILTLIFKTRKLQDYQYGNDPDLDAHAEITRQSATEGITLLKNEDALPLGAAMNVALLGSTSYDFIAGGTGSGDVNEAYTISLEEGLANAGFEINAEAKAVFEQFRSANAEAFTKPEGLAAGLTPYQAPEMIFTDEQLTTIAASSDVGILTIGRNAGEGGDRVEKDDFLLSTKEQEMIKGATAAFHAAGKKLIVVLNIGGVIETASWKEQPDAILLAWQGGQEGGNSVADILSGVVSPSGKLPMTFPVRLADHASHANFPEGGEEQLTMASILTSLIFGRRDERPDAEKVATRDYTNYDEGIYVGYRHFDKADLEVSYPFGFGLSYTEFEYADLSAELQGDSIYISATIQNTGASAGKEVAQVFVTKSNTTIDRPDQELKAFTKTQLLAPAASETISLSIPVSDLRYWDEDKAQWSLESGAYEIKLGASSRDIRQMVQVEL
ncbi:MAG: glycoside hydrolase family 3 N-terminal domain-containing protein [Bacteroidota bacterium]